MGLDLWLVGFVWKFILFLNLFGCVLWTIEFQRTNSNESMIMGMGHAIIVGLMAVGAS